MKKMYMFRVNNFQLGALVPMTATDKIVEQERVDKSHTDITYIFDTDRELQFTQSVLNKRGSFVRFIRNSLPSNYWMPGIEDANQHDGETEFDLDLVFANEELPF